eukprot:CAMPEP_0198205212 /NCGR_PEP_ID=MMETSP1445-20131203/8706_1 /TAXON_ID=36898 /ORGANISM="Pyramimonas sp., Strain CCMP2087" /LENGTH=150 /DNA_ID=CAMNT_0043877413 /DNA_START=430 /DNA_END=882 /DNA_ORIENTATION=+
MQRFQRSEEQLQTSARQQPGARTFKQEGTIQASSGDGGYRQTYYSKSITIYGGRQGYQMSPAQGNTFFPIFVPVLLLTIYVGGAVRLLQGFDFTKYSPKYKLQMVLLWPFLHMFSQSFREEFRKAFCGVDPRRRKGARPRPLVGDDASEI